MKEQVKCQVGDSAEASGTRSKEISREYERAGLAKIQMQSTCKKVEL